MTHTLLPTLSRFDLPRAPGWRRAARHALVAVLMASAAGAAGAAESAVKWQMEVVQDGHTVDHFSAVTRLGQAQTETASHNVQHPLNCPAQSSNNPTPDINLNRTITLSPIHIDADSVSFAIDAREAIEDTDSPSGASGCTLPPQPRMVTASHPGLAVRLDGSWSEWKVIPHDPALTYRIQAQLVSPQ